MPVPIRPRVMRPLGATVPPRPSVEDEITCGKKAAVATLAVAVLRSPRRVTLRSDSLHGSDVIVPDFRLRPI